VESHPYAVAAIDPGTVVVADAAGNDLLVVHGNGVVRTLAVLPPQPLQVTSELQQGLGLPECTIGASYGFEAVPTDVEVGPDGLLYVSTLPGGPEDPSLGARGSVYTVDPNSGAVHRIATGFAGATNVAVAPDGAVYVAELFGGQVSQIVGAGGVPVASVPFPAGLEWANGKLYASIDAFGNGSVVTITP
jgi:DNA-binding beta-propeller fold protein YncE